VSVAISLPQVTAPPGAVTGSRKTSFQELAHRMCASAFFRMGLHPVAAFVVTSSGTTQRQRERAGTALPQTSPDSRPLSTCGTLPLRGFSITWRTRPGTGYQPEPPEAPRLVMDFVPSFTSLEGVTPRDRSLYVPGSRHGHSYRRACVSAGPRAFRGQKLEAPPYPRAIVFCSMAPSPKELTGKGFFIRPSHG
jgi:hypothetical protein